MIRVHLTMKFTNEPLKRMDVAIVPDTDPDHPIHMASNREGIAEFHALAPLSGKIMVEGAMRYQGYIDGDIHIELWSLVSTTSVIEEGAPDGGAGGSTAYNNMQTRTLLVNNREVLTDSEGYLVNLGDWSEGFVRAQAAAEGLTLNNEHWEVIRYLRSYYERHNRQASVRDVIKNFKPLWDCERACNTYLHDMFPRGGPQKQGNRLAGLMRTKGEH